MKKIIILLFLFLPLSVIALNGPNYVIKSLNDIQMKPGGSGKVDIQGNAQYSGVLTTPLTGQRALITDASSQVQTSTATSTELSYLSGVTSGLQSQINSKLTGSLTDSYIFIGNGSNQAIENPITGDILISNIGVTSIASEVITNGDISSTAAIARSKLASGVASYVLINNGSGVMSEEQYLSKTRGGTGQDNSSLTFPGTGTLATLAGSESLSNKTFSDELRLTELGATPSNPNAGVKKVYCKTDDKCYQLNSSGSEVELGAGAGGAGDATSVLEDGGFDTTVVSGEKGLVCVGTCTQETTIVKVGAGSLKIALTAQAGDVKKCYANTGNYWGGKFVEVRAFIKTAITGGKFQLYDDTTMISEVDIDSSDTFTEHVARGSIPTTGTPKICWRITTPSTTNNLYVDKTFAGDLRVDGTTRVLENTVLTTNNDGRVITANSEDVYFIGTGTGWNSSGDVHQYQVQNTDSVIELDTTLSLVSQPTMYLYLYKNNSLYKIIGQEVEATSLVDILHGSYTSKKGEFAKGDLLSIRTNRTITLTSSAINHYLNIKETKYEQSTVVSQEGFTGASIKWTNVTGCEDTESGASYAALNSASCTYASAEKTGNTLTPTTSGDVALKIPYLPAGEYDVSLMGVMYSLRTTTTTTCGFELYNAATGKELSIIRSAAYANGERDFVDGSSSKLKITTPISNYELVLRAAKLGGDGTCGFFASNNTTSIEISIKPISQHIVGVFPSQKVGFVKDYEADNVDGGACTASTWVTRALDTLEGDTSDIFSGAIAASAFTLLAGNYEIEWSAPAYSVDQHQTRLYNQTAGSVASVGSSESATSTQNVQTRSTGSYKASLSSNTTFRIEHWCGTNTGGADFGKGSAVTGVNNLYTIVKVRKL